MYNLIRSILKKKQIKKVWTYQMSDQNSNFNPKCMICDINCTIIPDYWAVTNVTFNNKNESTYNPAHGIPMRVFMCPKCHELKFYPRSL